MSNIELLRIVAMALIIAAHLSYWGGAYYHTEGVNRFIASLFVVGGKLGVSLYVMIGSIFMAKRNVSFRAIFRIVLTMMFVVFSIAITGVIMGKPVSILNTFNPTTKYWFVNVYVALMLVSPYLNKLISIMNFRMYRNFCIVLTFIAAIYPTFKFNGEFTNQFIWFLYLYFLVNFILKYKTEINTLLSSKRLLSIVAKTYILFAGVGYVFMAYLIFRDEYFFPLRNSGSIVLLAVALGIFMFFYKLNIGHCGFINWVAKGTFVAYLIHDNGYVRKVLWGDLLKCEQWYNMPDFIVYGTFVIIGILFLGAIAAPFVDKIISFILNRFYIQELVAKLDAIIKT